MARAATLVRLERRFWPALRTVHAWAGLAACSVLFVVGLTGALLVFEDAVLRATVPGAERPPVHAPEALAAAVVAAERTFGTTQLRWMNFGSDRFGLHEVGLADGGGAWLDPTTLAVVERWDAHGRLGEWLFALHHQLLAGEIGETVLGAAALVGLALVVTGIAWWAKLRFRGPRAWPATASARELDAAHRTWGTVFALPLALLLATGAAMVFEKPAKALLGAVVGGPVADPPTPRAAAPAGGTLRWSEGLAAAQARFPDAVVRLVVWPRDGVAPLVRLRRAAEWHANGRTMAWFDPASGALLEARDALARSPAVRLYYTFWPLHASRVGGPAWQLLATATGLALALLSAVGAWAYLRRLRR